MSKINDDMKRRWIDGPGSDIINIRKNYFLSIDILLIVLVYIL